MFLIEKEWSNWILWKFIFNPTELYPLSDFTFNVLINGKIYLKFKLN
jgi:hypothetical protein